MKPVKVALVVVLIVFLVVLVWKHYWRLQAVFNPSLFSMSTPSHFAGGEAKMERFGQEARRGFGLMGRKRVVICSLLRDVADRVADIRKRIEGVGSLFHDYRVLLVENDSADGTRKLLREWSRQDPRVRVLGCPDEMAETCRLDLPKTLGHSVDRARIEKMARLRNVYLDEVKKTYPLWDFAVVWDADVVGSIYFDGIAHSVAALEADPGLAGVCANGVYRWGPMTIFYDTYALQEPGDEFSIDRKLWHDLKKGLFFRHGKGDALVPVASCFSGFAVYKTAALAGPGVYYDTNPEGSGNLECEHARFSKRIPGRLAVNPSMIFLVSRND